ncbi:hypothetical protein BGY98DRAFT_66171 [Russula aff. rugulosa BPL654]|nr:hypothetical protein BGY98DRAFT_66171 [Russula aff. rugulosa BPL654]
MSSLQNMPYDFLPPTTQNLDFADVCALQMTCRQLRSAIHTRPVYRELALGFLRRCCLSDLSTELRVDVVNRAAQPACPHSASCSNAFVPKGKNASNGTTKSSDEKVSGITSKSWYKVVGTPLDEEAG